MEFRLRRRPRTRLGARVARSRRRARRAAERDTHAGASRFGKLVTADTGTPAPTADGTLFDQPLRWQGRWFSPQAGGLYDFRNRWWSPELGAFLSPDEFVFHGASGTLWSWPRQNPLRFRDSEGRFNVFDLLSPEERQAIGDWNTNTDAVNFLRESSYRDVRLGNYGDALLDASAALAVSAEGILASPKGQVAMAIVLAKAGEEGCPEEGAHSNVLQFTPEQLQKGFGKHGDVFQLSGNWSPSRAADFSSSVNQHINDPAVVAVSGTYRTTMPATHYYNPATGVDVIATPSGEYVTALSLGEAQLSDLLLNGNVW